MIHAHAIRVASIWAAVNSMPYAGTNDVVAVGTRALRSTVGRFKRPQFKTSNHVQAS